MARPAGLDEEQRREQRRRALLDSALELFSSRGYLGTPIEDLCRHAHISTKSFYGVYTSREECYLDLMSEVTERLMSAMADAVLAETFAPGDHTPEDRLIGALAHLMADDPRGAVVLFGRGSATTFAVEERRRSNRRRAAQLLVGIWQRARPDADIRPGAATGTIGGLFDVVADWVAELHAEEHDPTRRPVEVLNERLLGFYDTLRFGMNHGKEILS